MTHRPETTRIDPELVGQETAPDAARPTATGGWFKLAALIWIVPILLGFVFLAAILVAVI